MYCPIHQANYQHKYCYYGNDCYSVPFMKSFPALLNYLPMMTQNQHVIVLVVMISFAHQLYHSNTFSISCNVSSQLPHTTTSIIITTITSTNYIVCSSSVPALSPEITSPIISLFQSGKSTL